MADLRTCYFCGTGPGGSLDSYGVVPSALDPSPDEQRSVVLCPDCRNKLTALLRPVVDAAETAPAAGAGSSGLSPADDEVTGLADSTPEADETPQSSGGPSAGEPSPGKQSPGKQSPGSGSASTEGSADEPAGSERSPGEPADAGEPANTGEPPNAGEAADAGEPTDESEGPGPSPGDSAGSDPPATGESGEPADRSITFDDSDDSAESDSGLAASGGSDEAPSKPTDPSAEAMMGDDTEAYRKVIRLLQNRDFPVRRDEIEELATSAYELGPRECSDAIDAIIQKGLLVEEEGTLRRTGD